MAGQDPVVAASLVALAVALHPWRDERASDRLVAEERDLVVGPVRIGVASTIAAMGAAIRHGATAVQAFEEQAGRPFATGRVTRLRAQEALERRARTEETQRDLELVARQLAAACALGDELGGGTARCLDAVAASWRRTRLLEDRRRVAMAGPEATVRMLTGLPVATVVVGELLGARPLAWLTGSLGGWMCFAAGLGCYAVGLAWMRRMLGTLRRAD